MSGLKTNIKNITNTNSARGEKATTQPQSVPGAAVEVKGSTKKQKTKRKKRKDEESSTFSESSNSSIGQIIPHSLGGGQSTIDTKILKISWLEKENKHLQSKISDLSKQTSIDKKLIEELTSLTTQEKDEVKENGDVDLK